MIEAVRRFTIYGLRAKGSKEVRYVGQTMRPLEARMFNHLSLAQNHPFASELTQWLSSTDVEIFKIAYVDTREEALATERALIALCAYLDHRLFNKRSGPSGELMTAFLARSSAT